LSITVIFIYMYRLHNKIIIGKCKVYWEMVRKSKKSRMTWDSKSHKKNPWHFASNGYDMNGRGAHTLCWT
jgi:hypothetical protein